MRRNEAVYEDATVSNEFSVQSHQNDPLDDYLGLLQDMMEKIINKSGLTQEHKDCTARLIGMPTKSGPIDDKTKQKVKNSFLEHLEDNLGVVAQAIVNWVGRRPSKESRGVDLLALQYQRAIKLLPNATRSFSEIVSTIRGDVRMLKRLGEAQTAYGGQSPYSIWRSVKPLRLRLYTGGIQKDVTDPPNVPTLIMPISRLDESWTCLQDKFHMTRGELFEKMRKQSWREANAECLDEEVDRLQHSDFTPPIIFRPHPLSNECMPLSGEDMLLKKEALFTALTSTRRTYALYLHPDEHPLDSKEWERNLFYTTIHVGEDIVGGVVVYSCKVPEQRYLALVDAASRLMLYKLRAIEDHIGWEIYREFRAKWNAMKFYAHQIAHDVRKPAIDIVSILDDLGVCPRISADSPSLFDFTGLGPF